MKIKAPRGKAVEILALTEHNFKKIVQQRHIDLFDHAIFFTPAKSTDVSQVYFLNHVVYGECRKNSRSMPATFSLPSGFG